MINLRSLNLSNHPEFFMDEEKKEALKISALHGINPDDKKNVTFLTHNITI